MVDLITVKLEEICTQVTDGTHDSPKLISHGYPLIKGKDINKGYIDFENCDYISEEDHLKVISRSKPEHGDILFANIGNSIGDMAFVSTTKEFSIKNVALIKADITKVDNLYLYYYMLNKDFQNEIKSTKQGAAQPFISLNLLRNFELKINKKLKIQTKIAKVLSNYDDLIENNNKRIKILEEMAQKIYKEWFVDFKFPNHETATFKQTDLGKIPSDWEVKNLFDFADVLYGYAFKSNLFTETVEATPVVRIRDIKNQKTNTYSPEIPDEKYYIRDKEVLIGMDGEFHMCNWLGGKAYLNQRVAKLKPKDNKSYFYLLLLLQKPIKELNIAIQGTTVAHLGDTHLRNLNFAIPNDKMLAEFNALAENFLEEILSLTRKNVFLKQTRDILLPRLISGEIDVENMSII